MQFQRLLCPSDSVERHHLLGNTPRAQKFLRIVFTLFRLAPYDAGLLKREFIADNIAYCKEIFDRTLQEGSRSSNWDSDIRNILKFIVATGCQTQIRLDQPDSVWSRQFSWVGDTQSFNRRSWLVDYLHGLRNLEDNEVVTHTLLVLSGMRHLGDSPEWQLTYVKSLFSFMKSGRPDHVRHAALRATHDARSALASVNIPRDQVLPFVDHGEGPFNSQRDLCFLRLVFALSRNSNWIPHLVREDCVKRCVAIINDSLKWYLHPFYLIGFFFRIAPLDPEITDKQWQELTKEAWHAAAVTNLLLVDDDCVEALRLLVKGTVLHMIDGHASKDILMQLENYVASVLKMLERRMQTQQDSSPEREYIVHWQEVKSEVANLKDKVHEALAFRRQSQ